MNELYTYYEKDAESNALWGTRREQALVDAILPWVTGRDIIDIGAGSGFLAKQLHQKVVVLDLSHKRLLQAKKFGAPVEADCTSLPILDNSFDTVICSEVLEHIPSWKNTLKEMMRIAKRRVIITVPNDQPLVEIECPKCQYKHFLSGHLNRFTPQSFREQQKNIKTYSRFCTIFTYNKITLRFPRPMRKIFDKFIVSLEHPFSFCKAEFLLIIIDK